MEYQTTNGDYIDAHEGLVVETAEDGKVYIEIKNAGRIINTMATMEEDVRSKIEAGDRVVVKIVTTKRDGLNVGEKYHILDRL